MLTVRIFVLNYNGAPILEETIPSLLEAVSRSRHACFLSVIDNESSDESVELIRERFPSVEVLPMKNRILCSFNEALKDADEDVAILLNNDIRVDPGFVDALVEPFERDPKAFAVSPQILQYDGAAAMGGRCRAQFRWGLLRISDEEHLQEDASAGGWTFAAGAAGAYDRRKFLELGGYDDLYLPGTMEDIDLCFRAWRKGYRCYYEPKSAVYHVGRMSFDRRFGRYRTREVNARNNYLFFWKNFRDPGFWIQHVAALPLRFCWAAARGQPFWITGFFEAVSRIGDVTSRRRFESDGLGERRILEALQKGESPS